MFKSLNRVIYQVPDLEKAKEWYRALLEAEPVYDSPIFTGFRIGDSLLVLLPNSLEEGNAIPYWGVDDVKAAYEQLLQSGATPHSEIRDILGTTIVASVTDPFGNIIGIVGTAVDAAKRSPEFAPSVTAATVAFIRALTAVDERKEIRGQDYLAEIFLSDMQKNMINTLSAKLRIMNGVQGRYEFHIARTAYFDSIVLDTIKQNIPQIVFLGAGYDTRSYRFKNHLKRTRLFELDVPSTQERKKEILLRSGIQIPDTLTFVPVNFKTDTLEHALSDTGYNKNLKTLFIWEGVSYYLSEKEVNDTFSFIMTNSKSDSSICFDYMLDGYFHRASISSEILHPGEPFQFSIGEGKIESFLKERGFKLIEHLNAGDMGKRYLTLRDGSSAGNVRSGICLAYALIDNNI